MDKGLGGLQIQSERCGETKNILPPPGVKLRFVRRALRSLVSDGTIPALFNDGVTQRRLCTVSESWGRFWLWIGSNLEKSGRCLFQSNVLPPNSTRDAKENLWEQNPGQLARPLQLKWNTSQTPYVCSSKTGVTTTNGCNEQSSKISGIIRLLWKRGCVIIISDVDRFHYQ
jgi:hypothetical protein